MLRWRCQFHYQQQQQLSESAWDAGDANVPVAAVTGGRSDGDGDDTMAAAAAAATREVVPVVY